MFHRSRRIKVMTLAPVLDAEPDDPFSPLLVSPPLPKQSLYYF
jgi:hypothetical protein